MANRLGKIVSGIRTSDALRLDQRAYLRCVDDHKLEDVTVVCLAVLYKGYRNYGVQANELTRRKVRKRAIADCSREYEEQYGFLGFWTVLLIKIALTVLLHWFFFSDAKRAELGLGKEADRG